MNHGIVVGDDAFLGVTEEQRGIAFVLTSGETLLSFGADFGQLGVDFRGGDRALRDVNEVETGALFEETDGLDLVRWKDGVPAVRGPPGVGPSKIPADFEVRGDLGTISEFAR